MYKTASDCIDKWIPIFTNDERLYVANLFSSDEHTIGHRLIVHYIALIAPYLPSLSVEFLPVDWLASGLVFFYGCLSYIIHFPDWSKYLESIVLYNLLYILVDHYIDNTKLSGKNIKLMCSMVLDPIYTVASDEPLVTIRNIYIKLLDLAPKIKPIVVKLLQAELKGYYLQQSANNSREEYYTIALDKGGYTMELLYHLIDIEDESLKQATYDLGVIMQFIDDSLDVLDDKEVNIHTISTYDLSKDGNLDKLWYDIINRIDNIDNRLKLFTFLYLGFALYLPSRNFSHYSKNICNLTRPYNLFDYKLGFCGAKILTKSIKEYLTSKEFNISNFRTDLKDLK